MIDSAIAEEAEKERPLIDPEKPIREDLRTSAPKVDEWLDFFSRIVLKVGMELYTDLIFKDVDESLVTVADLKRIQVTKQERDTIARPFAEYATKNSFTKKHGRQIVALTDSAESLITLGIWARRVNRVAKKYKPTQPQQRKQQAMRPQSVRIDDNGYNGQATGTNVNGTTGGKLPDGEFGIYNPGSG
jgi:hypothetical protein